MVPNSVGQLIVRRWKNRNLWIQQNIRFKDNQLRFDPCLRAGTWVRMNRGGQGNFASIERLRSSGIRSTLDSTDSMHGPETLGGEPMLGGLSSKMLQKQFNLAGANFLRERQKNVRAPKISIVLEDLVLQDQMISERIPGQIGQNAVILVTIVAQMSEDDLRFEAGFDFLKPIFDRGPFAWKIALAKRPDLDLLALNGGQVFICAVERFFRPGTWRTEDYPTDFQIRNLRHQTEHRSARADFDIVRVCTETKNTAC